VKKSITDLQEVANKAAITASGLKPEHIDSVVIGNVNAVSKVNIGARILLPTA
jgi:acetyl-CoA acetyltransferase